MRADIAKPTEFLPTALKLSRGLTNLLKMARVTRAEYERWLANPEFVARFRREIEQRMVGALGMVWDKLLERAAVDGDVSAIREFLIRFDPDYNPRGQMADAGQAQTFTKAQYLRMMEIQYGKEEVQAHIALAKKNGQVAGPFNEEYLAGGKFEHATEVIDVQAEVSDSVRPARPEEAEDDELSWMG